MGVAFGIEPIIAKKMGSGLFKNGASIPQIIGLVLDWTILRYFWLPQIIGFWDGRIWARDIPFFPGAYFCSFRPFSTCEEDFGLRFFKFETKNEGDHEGM